MITGHFRESILPSDISDYRIITGAALLSIVSCVSTILLPAIIPKIVMLMFVVILLYEFRIHILQLIIISVLIPMAFTSVSSETNSVLIAVQVILALMWIIALLALGHETLESDRNLTILLAMHVFFAVNVIVSTLYNTSFGLFALRETIRYVLYAGLLFISYYFLRNSKILKKLIYTVILIAIPLAAYVYYFALGLGLKSIRNFGLVVMHGFNIGPSNANTVSNVLTDPLVILLSFMMFGIGKRKKYLGAALFIFLFIVWIALNSRSSYLLFTAAYLTLIMFSKRRWKYLLISASCSLLLLIIIETGVFPELNFFLRLQSGFTHRNDIWLAAIRMIRESPILGKGPGFFSPNKFMYMDPGIGRVATGIFDLSPHHVILERGVDFGIFGMIVQIFIWLFSVGVFIRNAPKLRQSENYYIYLASGAIWIGLIFRGMLGTSGNIASITYLAVILAMPKAIKSHISEKR